MKRLVCGILAHVDAGKTTLSEALLYTGGALRKLGRVDHGDAFLDTDAQERERGITIFSKQAELEYGDTAITLLDTPGHVDFSAEMERTLQVLDCAVLVISGTDGVQIHTRTLWKLLERYQVPTFLFVNKMDQPGADKAAVLTQLRARLSDGCVDFCDTAAERDENAAVHDEKAMEEFLDKGSLSAATLTALIGARKIFPCYFGSALKVEGVEEFLQGLAALAPAPVYGDTFGARVFKISRDPKGARLTHLKITGGTLRAKSLLSAGEGENRWEEKADQLRLYSGTKYQTVEEAPAGSVVAVTGLTRTLPGLSFGCEPPAEGPVLEPVLNYRLQLPESTDPLTVLPKLRQLEEEDPMLRILWNAQWKEIHVRLMGPVQLEVLGRLLRDRFALEATFGTGTIVYKETIADTVEGVGHFEPLRHYAEVHLLMEPAPRGSGLVIGSAVSTDVLDLNWQRLILTHLYERAHPGVLTGSPITDIKITLAAGRAHLKHTEGGDFRQATYRAVRQGLMQATSLLLEPFYDFRLELPPSNVGRAMLDLADMGATVGDPLTEGEFTVLTGYGPVSTLQNYWQDVSVYTRGQGKLSCSLRGYEPCHNPEEVVEKIGYEAEHDLENPADSVFCAHGAGFTVKWRDVPQYMHLDSCLRPAAAAEPVPLSPPKRREFSGDLTEDKELMAMYERAFGKWERHDLPERRPAARPRTEQEFVFRGNQGPEYVLVDGYNIIFAWDELKEVAEDDLGAARSMLEDILVNYQAFRRCEVILVFDAYKVRGNPGSVEKKHGIYIVYTKEAETADAYIEKTTYQLQKGHKVRVATSDRLEQMIVLGHGALRLSAPIFRAEVEETKIQIAEVVAAYNRKNNPKSTLAHLIKRENT